MGCLKARMNSSAVFTHYAQTTALLDLVLPWLPGQWLSVGAVNKHFRAAYRVEYPPSTTLSYACASKESFEWSLACTVAGARNVMICQFALAAAQLQNAPAALLCCRSQPKWSQEWFRRLSIEAASAGVISVLEYYESKGELYRCTNPEVVRLSTGVLLQWADAHSCGLCSNACLLAAGAGDLAIMQWLRQQGAAWDYDKTVAAAAASSNCSSWRLLDWLQQENEGGALWSQGELQQLLYSALDAGNTATADWLLAQGAPLPQQLWRIEERAGPVVLCVAGLQWARAKGCEWGDTWGSCEGEEYAKFSAASARHADSEEPNQWCELALRNSEEAVEWAHDNGCCPAECAVGMQLTAARIRAAQIESLLTRSRELTGSSEAGHKESKGQQASCCVCCGVRLP
jgi:hypothetical protein